MRAVRTLCSRARPLRVAFFGSDEFSILSLKKLVELKEKGIVDAVDVVAKHPKYTGRDLKELRDVPIATVATELSVPVVRAESNAEINELAANHYSMAIAVSYGKLIPKKFLLSVPYSLNLHPSLLPRYSGASPLQFALLNNDKETGVTVQTLHPTEFDRGAIVAQRGGIEISRDETLKSLRDRCAVEGAELLGEVITKGLYKDPSFKPMYEYSYAPKITPQMGLIDWEQSSDDIVRRYNTLGPLFTFKEIKMKKRRKPLLHELRRVILSDITRAVSQPQWLDLKAPGEFKLQDDKVIVRTPDGFIAVKTLQLEFEKKEEATKFMTSLPKRAGETPNIFTDKVPLEA